MRHMIAVFFGAASYGILSTIVVLAYGKGYVLGEVVGTQLMTGFLLSCLLSFILKWREKRQFHRQAAANKGSSSVNAQKTHMDLSWKQRFLLMGAGIPTATTGLLYYESLRYIPASLAIILLFQFVWIGVLIQAIRQRQWPQKLMLLVIFVVFSGTALAAGIIEQGIAQINPLGLLFGFLAAISYSLFILISGMAVPQAHPANRTMWMLAGAVMLVFLLFPPQFLWNGRIWSELMMYGALLGTFGAFIPPFLFAYGVPHVGEGIASVLGAAELPVAVLLSSIVLHEQVSAWQWVGVGIVLLAVAIPELERRFRRTDNTCPQ